MEGRILAEKVREIEMSEEMQERILGNCYQKMEDKKMNKNTTKSMFKRPMIAVASLALCLCVTGVTALAATGKLQGYFKDITNWNGAVTGTTYEQATEELELKITEVSDKLTVTITMVKPDMAPYSFIETFGLESYRIVDANGKVVAKGDRTELVEIVDGMANVMISLENVAVGEYKLIVTEMVGGSKADQPLVISGTWEGDFVR